MPVGRGGEGSDICICCSLPLSSWSLLLSIPTPSLMNCLPVPNMFLVVLAMSLPICAGHHPPVGVPVHQASGRKGCLLPQRELRRGLLPTQVSGLGSDSNGYYHRFLQSNVFFLNVTVPFMFVCRADSIISLLALISAVKIDITRGAILDVKPQVRTQPQTQKFRYSAFHCTPLTLSHTK
jgi:hypothetical protein